MIWEVANNSDSTGKYFRATNLELKNIPLINNPVNSYKFNNQIASNVPIRNPYKNDVTNNCIWALEQTGMQIRIKNIAINQDSNSLNQWLQSNPITFNYELKEPIITPIEPIEFDISQGATINISSDIAPMSTHKVILNRAGQIEQGIELIANLKSRVNDLENIYDSNLIATQHRLNNLKLNYELEREED